MSLKDETQYAQIRAKKLKIIEQDKTIKNLQANLDFYKKSKNQKIDQQNSELETKDKKIVENKKLIDEQKKTIDEQKKIIDEQKELTSVGEKRIAEQIVKTTSFKNNIADLHKIIADRNATISEQNRKIINQRRSNTQEQRKNDSLKKEVITFKERLDQKNEKLVEYQRKVVDQTKQIDLQCKRLTNQSNEIVSLEMKIDNQQKEISRQENDVKELEAITRKRGRAIDDLNNKLEQQKLLLEESNNKVQQNNKEVDEASKQIYEKNVEIESLRSKIKVGKARLHVKASQEVKSYQDKLSKAKKEIARLKKSEKEAKDKQISEDVSKNSELKILVDAKNKIIKDLQTEVEKKEAEYLEIKEDHDLFEKAVNEEILARIKRQERDEQDYIREINGLTEKWNVTLEKVTSLKEAFLALQDEKNALTKKLDDIQTEVEVGIKQSEIPEDPKEEESKTMSSVNSLQANLLEVKEDLKAKETIIFNLRNILVKRDDKIIKLLKIIEKMEDSLKKEKRSSEEIRSKHNQVLAEVMNNSKIKVDKESSISKLQSLIIEKNETICNFQAKVTAREKVINECKNKIENLEHDLLSKTRIVETKEAEVNLSIERMLQLKGEIKTDADRIANLENELEDKNLELGKVKSQLTETEAYHVKLKKRHADLKIEVNEFIAKLDEQERRKKESEAATGNSLQDPPEEPKPQQGQKRCLQDGASNPKKKVVKAETGGSYVVQDYQTADKSILEDDCQANIKVETDSTIDIIPPTESNLMPTLSGSQDDCDDLIDIKYNPIDVAASGVHEPLILSADSIDEPSGEVSGAPYDESKLVADFCQTVKEEIKTGKCIKKRSRCVNRSCAACKPYIKDLFILKSRELLGLNLSKPDEAIKALRTRAFLNITGYFPD